MRPLDEVSHLRDLHAEWNLTGVANDPKGGMFRMKSPIDGQILVIIADSDCGWDHVSISRKNRVPNWAEMEHVKRTFFRDDETAMQLHVPPDDHVNMHPYVLHLWRPHDVEIPRPPAILVGVGATPVRNKEEATQRALEHFALHPEDRQSRHTGGAT